MAEQHSSGNASADPNTSKDSFLFDWHINQTQAALRLLHEHERGREQEIADLAAELRESNLFWRLLSRYTDALDAARKANDENRVNAIELVMFARMVAVGTLRRTHVFEDVTGRVTSDDEIV